MRVRTPAAPDRPRPGATGRHPVVLADDSLDMRLLLRAVLERSGCFAVVGEAAEGTRAIELSLRLQPALLVLDLSMPGVDGFAVLSELRVRAPGVAVVVHTGLASELTGLGPEDGVAAYLPKDLPDGELVARLLEVVGAPRALPSPRAATSPVAVDLVSRLGAALRFQDELLASGPGPDQVLALLADHAAELVGATGSGFAVLEGGGLHLRGCRGLLAGAEGARWDADGGLAATALRDGQVLSSAAGRTATGPWAGLGVGSLVAVPLRPTRHPHLVLTLASPHPGAFDNHDRHVLALVSRVAAARLDLAHTSDALAASERLFRTTLDGAPIGTGVVSLEGCWLQVNDALSRTVGHPREALLGRHLQALVHPADVPSGQVDLDLLLAGAVTGCSRETRFRHADGHTVWARRHLSLVRDEAGTPQHLVVQVEDISEVKAQQSALERLTLTDPLTGLANRTLVMDRLDTALQRLRRSRGRVAFLIVDLDHFKVVNDSLGHQAGDALVVAVGARLRQLARAQDTVGRLGGDEFVLLLEDLDSTDDANGIGQRVVDALTRPFHLPGFGEVRVGGSVGVATTTSAAVTRDDLYRQADLALYQAKADGRGQAAVFDLAMQATAQRRLQAENALRRALATDGLTAHYQPIVDLRTGRTVAAEALARLRSDPALPAGDLVVVAEDCGLVAELDAVVLRQVARWTQHPPPGAAGLTEVHVNVSSASLSSPAWREVARSLGPRPVPVSLEVTERTLLEPSSPGSAELDALMAAGVRVGLDDFGTGFSSLACLHERALSFVKLDRSFVVRLPGSARARGVVEGVVGIAHRLGLLVVAEGIETQDELAAVRALGCDRGQGWLFGAAVPLEALGGR